jgi:ferredoxin-NADP reductase
MSHKINILSIEPLTSDVMRYRTSKPEGYNFKPGQATDVAIDKDGWRDEKRPFTFTSLPDEDTLEFTIKSYRDHEGVTNELQSLVTGDALIIEDPWGTIQFKGNGTFVAGGAGVTPFLAIFKDLEKRGELHGNKLIFGNKTREDIIAQDLLSTMPELKVLHVLSEEDTKGYAHGFIDKDVLSANVINISDNIYVCGPPPMMDSVMHDLKELGADPDALTFEE